MQKADKKISIALVDDHNLFRKGLLGLIEMVDDNIDVLFEADNGIDMQKKLAELTQLPDIILMDINMPEMDGFESVTWLNKNYPAIKVLVVSMVENEESIIRMLKLKVKGYLSKDVEPAELGDALNAIMSKGFYYTDFITGKLVHTLQNEHEREALAVLNEKEKKFIQLACSELTYNDIAGEMFVSPKTIDGYRNNLFDKLHIKSRVGLALYAVKHGLVKL
jgi:two-component system, NarL family, invasion response regulator UvrY